MFGWKKTTCTQNNGWYTKWTWDWEYVSTGKMDGTANYAVYWCCSKIEMNGDDFVMNICWIINNISSNPSERSYPQFMMVEPLVCWILFFGAPWIKRKLLSMTKYVWVVRYFELCVWASMYVCNVCMYVCNVCMYVSMYVCIYVSM